MIDAPGTEGGILELLYLGVVVGVAVLALAIFTPRKRGGP